MYGQDQGTTAPSSVSKDKHQDLASWIMRHVDTWRQTRDNNYKEDWIKYYSIWSGKFVDQLRQKTAERSKLIAPATQNAVDQTVAEMVEATFGRGAWFDISPDKKSADSSTLSNDELVRDNLLFDLDRDRISSRVTDVYTLGAIYGTGIAKRCIEDYKGSVKVYWEAIAPFNFVIDTASTTVEDALGCAHETIRPKHEIEDKQESGEYFQGDLGDASGMKSSDILRGARGESLAVAPEDGVYITEWHGKIPAHFFEDAPPEDEELADDDTPKKETSGYVESLVVIANSATVLKAEKNVIQGEDRGIIAYQHHRRPNSFWGMGQVEKAMNSQAALDSELRARMDTLALTTYPIAGADATRLPKNINLSLTPGKFFLTNGRPSEIIEPLKFGQLDPISFQQSAEFERMVGLSTGNLDPSTTVNNPSGPATASGASISRGSAIKRAKLTMQTVDSDFLDPLVRKSILAYCTLDPDRYPIIPEFQVNSTMSIMAREFEQMQMTNLLAIIPHESPAYNLVLRSIVENYSGMSKDQIIAGIDAMSKPNPEQQKMQQQAAQMKLAEAQKQLQKLDAEIQEIASRATLNTSRSQSEVVKTNLAGEQLHIQAAQTMVSKQQADVSAQQVAVQREKVHLDAAVQHKKIAAMAKSASSGP